MDKNLALETLKSFVENTDNVIAKDAILALHPELAESEDERIRKWLIDYFDKVNDEVIKEERLKIITYLGKQKEQKPVPDKFSGLKSLMLQYLQSAANRKDDAEIESDTDLFGRKILDYVWKQDEKQKEQKHTPVWMPKFLDKLRSKKNYFDWDEHRDIEGHILAIINWIAPDYFDRKEKRQKSIECLKPEKDCWYVCVKDFYGGGKKQSSKGDLVQAKGGMYMMGRDDISEWFRKAYYDEIKPAEWSEEDEKIKRTLTALAFDDFEKGGMSKEEYTKIFNWLKSLRPQPYKVGGVNIDVRMVERLDDNKLGTANLPMGLIQIANTYNKDCQHSIDGIRNTFYHELVHTILDTMGEYDLSSNERFVCSFSSFLTEAMSDAYFKVEVERLNKD